MRNRFTLVDVEAYVTIVDEDGNEVVFLVGEAFNVDDKQYEILVPLDVEDEGYLFRVEEEYGETVFIGVTDKDEERVAMEVYEAICDEEEE